MKAAVCGLMLAAAAAAPVRGPWLGLVFDSGSKSLRPVLGLPGAASLGAPLEIPFALERAVAAHRGGFALAIDSGGSVFAVAADGARKLAGVRPFPGEIVFSPSARFAALYYGEEESVDLVSGLPDRPALAARLRTPGPVAALAVSDGGVVLAGLRAGAVYDLRQGRSVLAVGEASAIAFIGATGDALVADRAAGLVYRIGVRRGSFAVKEPGALGVSADGRRAVVAGAAPVVLNLETGTAEEAPCACKATLAEPLAGNAVFRLTADSEPVMWVLDAAGPRLFFIPAGKGGQ